jgi:MFS transporter, DHA2 family, multidrug resistance protein
VPADAAETTRDTLGGAVAASDELPDSTAARVLDAANEAFVQGFQVVALASAGLAALSAIGVALFLRNVRGPAGETEVPSSMPLAESH